MTAFAAPPSVFDINNLAALKGAVRKDDPKAIKAAAQQFEAVFMQMVLKSMREAAPREGMFDSEQTRMYESLLDQQLAQVMSAKGNVGLAALIEKQLAGTSAAPVAFPDGLPLTPAPRSYRLDGSDRFLPLTPHELPSRSLPIDRAPHAPGRVDAAPAAPAAAPQAAADDIAATPAAREFAARVWPHAASASRATGIPAHFLVAQAALETGWGRAEPRAADGTPSYNLFGIKAGRAWNGAAVEAPTTEVVDGLAQRRVERFRAYGSYAEAFGDYANLLLSSPRYAGVVGARDSAAFSQGLQRAGYATDPLYAAKLERIIGGPTLRKALIG